MKVKLNKNQWEKIGKEAGWFKRESQIINMDGFADGGEAYTEDEMDLMAISDIKANRNRPEKIKQIMDLYVEMHPSASGYEINTLWHDIGQMSIDEIDQYVGQYVSKWTRS